MDYSLPGSPVHGILQARMGCHAFLQGIFPTQAGPNSCPLCVLHWQVSTLPPAPPGNFFTSLNNFFFFGGLRRLKLFFYKLEAWTQEWGLFLGRPCRVLLNFNIWLLLYFLLGIGEHAKHILCLVVGIE